MKPGEQAKVGIFYGRIDRVNGAKSAADALKVFSRFDVVVFPGGAQYPQATAVGWLHDVAQRLILGLRKTTKVYGYSPVGFEKQAQIDLPDGKVKGLTLYQMEESADLWAQMGAEGVLLDTFGFDYGVTRERQAAVMRMLDRRNLRAILNGWKIADLFTGEPPLETPVGTKYLFENLGVDEKRDLEKMGEVLHNRRMQGPIGVELYGVAEEGLKVNKTVLKLLDGFGYASKDGVFGADDNRLPVPA